MSRNLKIFFLQSKALALGSPSITHEYFFNNGALNQDTDINSRSVGMALKSRDQKILAFLIFSLEYEDLRFVYFHKNA